MPLLPVKDQQFFFTEILRVLGANGLFAFASFGPGTLRNFYEELMNLGVGSSCELPADKHDLGDTLINLGFDSPVLASSNIVLKYSDPGKAYNEMRKFLYLSPAFKRNFTAHGRALKKLVLQSLEKCRDRSGSVALNIEMIAGHAWKGNKNSPGTVQLSGIPIVSK